MMNSFCEINNKTRLKIFLIFYPCALPNLRISSKLLLFLLCTSISCEQHWCKYVFWLICKLNVVIEIFTGHKSTKNALVIVDNIYFFVCIMLTLFKFLSLNSFLPNEFYYDKVNKYVWS